MVTVEAIEQLHAIADAVLRKHNANIDLALPEFMHITTAAGLTPDSRTIPQMRPTLEYSARQYLTTYAKETSQ
jgi:hypothetical protein